MGASKEQSDLATKKHAIITKYWAFSGWSAKKISEEFDRDEELHKEFGSVSIPSVEEHIRRIRIEFETYVDEDALEKYTSEFVRKQHQYDNQLDLIEKMQNTIDVDDVKGQELWLKFESQKTAILDKQIKMMSDIELVLMIKQMNARRRKELKTLKVVDTDKLAKRVAPKALELIEENANRTD